MFFAFDGVCISGCTGDRAEGPAGLVEACAPWRLLAVELSGTRKVANYSPHFEPRDIGHETAV